MNSSSQCFKPTLLWKGTYLARVYMPAGFLLKLTPAASPQTKSQGSEGSVATVHRGAGSTKHSNLLAILTAACKPAAGIIMRELLPGAMPLCEEKQFGTQQKNGTASLARQVSKR